MGACGAKYGIATSHFYWIGAIPAMVFVGIFMMPFYYGSRARSVPEYLKLRFDEKTRGLNAISFAVMTVFSSGVSMYAMGKLLQLLLGWDFNFSVLLSAGIVLVYTYLGGLTSAIYNEVLQFFLIVVRLRAAGHPRPARRRRVGGLTARLARGRGAARLRAGRAHPVVAAHGQPGAEPDGRRVVRPGDGPRLRAVVRLLVHRLPRRAAGDGRRLDELGAAHAAHRRVPEDALPVPGDPARHDRDRRCRTARPCCRRTCSALQQNAAGATAGQTGDEVWQGIVPPKVDEKTGEPVRRHRRQASRATTTSRRR